MTSFQNDITELEEHPILPDSQHSFLTESPSDASQDAELEPWPALSDFLEDYYQQLGTQGSGLKTYLKKNGEDKYPFDEALEGLRGIVIIGGEPGSGKTALALQIGFDAALDGQPVIIYSFEMPKVQLVNRFFQRVGEISYKKLQIKVGDLLSDDLERLNKAGENIKPAASNIVIRETKDFFKNGPVGAIDVVFDFSEQIRHINQITKQYGTAPLVIIDSLHEIPVDQKYARELKQKIDFIMLNLRNMCDQTGATFLLISHQSRSGQKDGGLTSFMGSASIEYTVDMALTINVPVDDQVDREGCTQRELIVAKNRYGPKPKALLNFKGQYMSFTYRGAL